MCYQRNQWIKKSQVSPGIFSGYVKKSEIPVQTS
jgi:hypothetical protein